MRARPTQVEVALPLPLDQTFTYLWPDTLPTERSVGWRVLVPFGKRQLAGYVVDTEGGTANGSEPSRGPPRHSLKEILSLLDEEPLFGPRELRFYRWIAGYYLAPLGEVLRTALPVSMSLRSYRAARILPEGLWALEKGAFLTDPETSLMRLLQGKGRTTLQELRRRHEGPVDRVLQDLERKGFVERCELFRGSRARGKTVSKRLTLRLPRSDRPLVSWTELLPPEEQAVLRHLVDHGPCPTEELTTAVPGSEEALASLQRRGFVELASEADAAPGETGPASRLSPPPRLTPEQADAVGSILPVLEGRRFGSFLLHGITGSGKTEVYLRVIEQALRQGRDALVLVPEIALTPQTVQRFASRLGEEIAVLHSRLTDSERLACWWKIRRGRVRIAIGARSALFAPFQRLGVVVVDEEHDSSYKQQDRVRYNGRDLAVVRGQQEKAVVILGSATPSLESYYNTQQGKSSLLELRNRIGGSALPEVTPIDLREAAPKRSQGGCLSPALQKALTEAHGQGRKSLVFLNRRGFAHTLVCRDCGHIVRCPSCSVSLTYHRAAQRLCCHYCEHRIAAPERCPSCQGARVEPVGRGTERIEEEIRSLVPQARVGRMDRDTTRRKGSHERILDAFRGDGLDILIGTQMIAKGHDIPEVTLVGIVLADTSLDLPDFRASERTLQLLMQVAGRAGRGAWPGRVFVQTYHPEHYCIQSACRQDYAAFYAQELAFRKELRYPPFCRMVNLRVTGGQEQTTREAAERLGDLARTLLDAAPSRHRSIELLGPSEAPLARLRGRYRHHCFLKGDSMRGLLGFTRELMARSGAFLSRRNLQLEVDVDPVQVL